MTKKTQRSKASGAEKAKLSLEAKTNIKKEETRKFKNKFSGARRKELFSCTGELGSPCVDKVENDKETLQTLSTIKEEKPKIKIEKIETEKESKGKDKEEFIYVYGIINRGEFDLEIKGLRDAPIKKIDFQDIAVLVSDYPVLHPAVEEKEAMLHAEILNKLAQKITIIPMAFGTVFKDKDILENVLAKSRQTAKAALNLIEGKMELGVKIVKKELDGSDGLAKEILEPLSRLAVKTIQGDKFSDRLLLNNSFLVERKKFPEFSEKVGELEEKHSELKFLYTGPWPPYSFVNIKINGN